MSAVHYWWEGACYAAIACGQRGAVEEPGASGRDMHQVPQDQRFRSGVVHRGR